MGNEKTQNTAKEEEQRQNNEDRKSGDRNNKKINSQYPDPDNYISNTFARFSLHELQNELEKFSKTISVDKAKLDHLVPKKFSQFIQCKKVMERISSDYSSNNLVSQNSGATIKQIVSKFEQLISKYKIDLEQKDTGGEDVELSKGAMLLNYKEILRSNLLNFPVFLETFEKCKKIFEEGNNIDIIRPELIDFLAVIYDKISKDDTTFEEVCDLANLYIDVLLFQGDLTAEQKKLKIHNTILVNFKESTYSRAKPTEEYYKYLFMSLAKALQYLINDHAEDAIEHTFQMFYHTLSKTDPRYCRVVFKHINDFGKSSRLSASNLKVFKDLFSDMKIDLFSHFVSNSSLNEAVDIFDVFLSSFKERETGRAQDVLLKKVERHLINSERHGFEYLNDQVRDVEMISRCLGTKESKNMRQLNKRLKEKKDTEVTEIANVFQAAFHCPDEDGIGDWEVSVLMKAVRIIDSTPEYNKEILSKCKEQIMRHSVVAYFLQRYLNTTDIPVMNEEERRRIEGCKGQFDFLLTANK